MRELALFAGGGGGILGGKLLGWRTVCAVEINPYARKVLLARQRDGILEPFPIWDDITTFDGTPWRGAVDVVSGGFPCQDISAAGKGAGIEGEQSGLWLEMARVIREVRPQYVFVENSPMLTSRGLGCVLGDLAEMGYDAKWGVLGAHHVGAPHKRDRIWVVATNPNSEPVRDHQQRQARRRDHIQDGGNPKPSHNGTAQSLADSESQRLQGPHKKNGEHKSENGERDCESVGSNAGTHEWWAIEPNVGRVADGVAHRVDRLKTLGNGQVPAVAALAWNMLSGGM